MAAAKGLLVVFGNEGAAPDLGRMAAAESLLYTSVVFSIGINSGFCFTLNLVLVDSGERKDVSSMELVSVLVLVLGE